MKRTEPAKVRRSAFTRTVIIEAATAASSTAQ